MVGIKTTRPAKEVIFECIEQGVLCLSAKDKVRLLPALNIPFEQLEKAILVIKKACAKIWLLNGEENELKRQKFLKVIRFY